MTVAAVVLVVLAVAFAWSMGAHYTGACMGMPYASGSIRLWPALGTMAACTLVGATFLSHRVLATVGHHVVASPGVGIGAATAIVAAAFVLTTVYTYLKIPTSTIQILIFCIVGVGLALRLPVDWGTIGRLAVLWVIAPFAALGLGFGLTRLFDRMAILRGGGGGGSAAARLLVIVGAAASLTMGANDVSNATGVFLMTHVAGVFACGTIGGVGLALGVLTWGKPLLRRVAFDIVKVDLTMATAAQWVQALVVLAAVGFGYFTSMNQALIGAMAGTGLARGRQTVQWPVVRGIVAGWLIGPASGLVLAYGIAEVLRMLGLT